MWRRVRCPARGCIGAVRKSRKEKNKNIERCHFVNFKPKKNKHLDTNFTALTLLVANLEGANSIKEKKYEAIVSDQQCKLQMSTTINSCIRRARKKNNQTRKLTKHGKGMQLTKIRRAMQSVDVTDPNGPRQATSRNWSVESQPNIEEISPKNC